MVQHFLGFYLTIWNWGSRHPMSTVSISKHLTCCKILCTSTFWMKSSLVAEIGAQLGFSDSWFWSNFHPSKKQPSKNSAFRCFSIFDLFLGPIRAGLPTVCQIHTSIHESWVGRDQQRLALSLACHGIKQTSSNISLEQSLGMGKSSIFRHISSFFFGHWCHWFSAFFSLPGAKLVSLSSHSVAIIPLESLEGMLQLCEDALAPLEGGRWQEITDWWSFKVGQLVSYGWYTMI